jgi:hypothetical protein
MQELWLERGAARVVSYARCYASARTAFGTDEGDGCRHVAQPTAALEGVVTVLRWDVAIGAECEQ